MCITETVACLLLNISFHTFISGSNASLFLDFHVPHALNTWVSCSAIHSVATLPYTSLIQSPNGIGTALSGEGCKENVFRDGILIGSCVVPPSEHTAAMSLAPRFLLPLSLPWLTWLHTAGGCKMTLRRRQFLPYLATESGL